MYCQSIAALFCISVIGATAFAEGLDVTATSGVCRNFLVASNLTELTSDQLRLRDILIRTTQQLNVNKFMSFSDISTSDKTSLLKMPLWILAAPECATGAKEILADAIPNFWTGSTNALRDVALKRLGLSTTKNSTPSIVGAEILQLYGNDVARVASRAASIASRLLISEYRSYVNSQSSDRVYIEQLCIAGQTIGYGQPSEHQAFLDYRASKLIVELRDNIDEN